MAEAQSVTNQTGVSMTDTGQSGNTNKSTSGLLREPPGRLAPGGGGGAGKQFTPAGKILTQ